MSQFGEFDIPEEMTPKTEGKLEKPTEKPSDKPVEDVRKPERTNTPSSPRRAPRASGGSFNSFASFFGKLVNPLLTIAGGWYVYNWFVVEQHGFEDDGSMVALVVGAVAAFSAFNFVASLIGKAIGGIFRVFRTLIGIALFGALIYFVLNSLSVL